MIWRSSSIVCLAAIRVDENFIDKWLCLTSVIISNSQLITADKLCLKCMDLLWLSNPYDNILTVSLIWSMSLFEYVSSKLMASSISTSGDVSGYFSVYVNTKWHFKPFSSSSLNSSVEIGNLKRWKGSVARTVDWKTQKQFIRVLRLREYHSKHTFHFSTINGIQCFDFVGLILLIISFHVVWRPCEDGWSMCLNYKKKLVEILFSCRTSTTPKIITMCRIRCHKYVKNVPHIPLRIKVVSWLVRRTISLWKTWKLSKEGVVFWDNIS